MTIEYSASLSGLVTAGDREFFSYLVSMLSDATYRIQRSRRAKPKVIHEDLLKTCLGLALRSWSSGGEETSTPVVSRAGGDEKIQPVIISGPVSVVARGGEPRGSVLPRCLQILF